MRVFGLIAALAVLAASAGAVSTDAERAEAAERIAERAQRTLDGILGPGRSQVQVEVQGERAEITSETEILLPIDKSSNAGKAAMRLLDLPGYAKDKPSETSPAPAAASGQPFFQKDHEQSRREAGFQIKSIQATVVLDSTLGDAAVRDATQLLPQVLRLDTTRGDTMSLLRAPLRPAWRSAFSTPGDWRSAAYAAGGGLVALLAALIAGAGLIGAGKALGRELASRPRPEAAAGPAGTAEPLPELAPGAAGLLEPGAAVAGAASPQLLGRRFDFLSTHDPELVARGLALEKPEDLALFFGHLSESIPDLASRLFARLPSDSQAQVSESLLKINVADPERLGAVEDRLRQAVENGVLGPQSLGRILSRVPGGARAELLGRLAARDSRAVEQIEKHVFAFEDIETLPPAPLRRLLTALPYEVWGLALRGAPAALAERVLAELPDGPREAARAAKETPQPREKVLAERSRVLDVIADLAAKGELTPGRADEGSGLL